MFIDHIFKPEFKALRNQMITRNLNHLILFSSIASPFLMMHIFWSKKNDFLMTISTILLIIYFLCIVIGIYLQKKTTKNMQYMTFLTLAFILSTMLWLILLPQTLDRFDEYLYLSALMFLLMSGFIVISPLIHIPVALFLTSYGIYFTYKLEPSSTYYYGLIMILGFYVVFSNINRYNHEVNLYYIQLKHEQDHDVMKDMSQKDYLTGLYTNKYMYDQIVNATHLYQRYHSPFSVMMIDIDNFRKINDALGQVVGDDIIITLANMIISSIRETDLASRYTGKKFLILMQNTNLTDSILMAERLRVTCQEHDFEIGSPVTISIGLKSYDGSDVHQYIDETLLLLREAKMSGKNNLQY
ncbi:MAG: GGDEF domain-containing protein [Clostridia bacterium]|nr:GGDEF domain-containing protein [Clostridia bacterium]